MTIAQSLEHSWIKVRWAGLLPFKDAMCDKACVRGGTQGSGPGWQRTWGAPEVVLVLAPCDAGWLFSPFAHSRAPSHRNS